MSETRKYLCDPDKALRANDMALAIVRLSSVLYKLKVEKSSWSLGHSYIDLPDDIVRDASMSKDTDKTSFVYFVDSWVVINCSDVKLIIYNNMHGLHRFPFRKKLL